MDARSSLIKQKALRINVPMYYLNGIKCIKITISPGIPGKPVFPGSPGGPILPGGPLSPMAPAVPGAPGIPGFPTGPDGHEVVHGGS